MEWKHIGLEEGMFDNLVLVDDTEIVGKAHGLDENKEYVAYVCSMYGENKHVGTYDMMCDAKEAIENALDRTQVLLDRLFRLVGQRHITIAPSSVHKCWWVMVATIGTSKGDTFEDALVDMIERVKYQRRIEYNALGIYSQFLHPEESKTAQVFRVQHKATEGMIQKLEQAGIKVTRLPVDEAVIPTEKKESFMMPGTMTPEGFKSDAKPEPLSAYGDESFYSNPDKYPVQIQTVVEHRHKETGELLTCGIIPDCSVMTEMFFSMHELETTPGLRAYWERAGYRIITDGKNDPAVSGDQVT